MSLVIPFLTQSILEFLQLPLRILVTMTTMSTVAFHLSRSTTLLSINGYKTKQICAKVKQKFEIDHQKSEEITDLKSDKAVCARLSSGNNINTLQLNSITIRDGGNGGYSSAKTFLVNNTDTFQSNENTSLRNDSHTF